IDELGTKTLELRQIQLTEAIAEMEALEGEVSAASLRVEYLTRQLQQFPNSKEAAGWAREIASLNSVVEVGQGRLQTFRARLLEVNAALAERNRLEKEGAEAPATDSTDKE